MALVTTIDIDLGSGTATLTCISDGNTAEVVTYNNTSQTITFAERGELTISGVDFMSLEDQFKIFETAIVFNYSPNQFTTNPFNQVLVNENQDTGTQTWNLTVFSVSDPNAIEYTANLNTLDILLHKRSPEKIIVFSEWIKTLLALSHYRLSVRNYLNL